MFLNIINVKCNKTFKWECVWVRVCVLNNKDILPTINSIYNCISCTSMNTFTHIHTCSVHVQHARHQCDTHYFHMAERYHDSIWWQIIQRIFKMYAMAVAVHRGWIGGWLLKCKNSTTNADVFHTFHNVSNICHRVLT